MILNETFLSPIVGNNSYEYTFFNYDYNNKTGPPDECNTIDDYDGFTDKLNTIMTVTWSLITVFGVLSNGLVLAVFLGSSQLITVTQYYIINLALSDLIFLLVCPAFLIINYNQNLDYNQLPVALGNFMCKLDYFSTHVAVFITCLTLLTMTFDRYLVIMHPLKALSFRSKQKVIIQNVLIWIVSIMLCIPRAYYRKVEVIPIDGMERRSCVHSMTVYETMYDFGFYKIDLDQFFVLYTILVSYILPLLIIIICYIIMINKLNTKSPQTFELTKQSRNQKKQRRKILFIIGSMTALFGFCWLPINTINFSLKFNDEFPYCSKLVYTIKAVSHTLTFLNSMLNPFFHTIIGNSFQKKASEQTIRLKSLYSRDSLSRPPHKCTQDQSSNIKLNNLSQTSNSGRHGMFLRVPTLTS